MKESDVIGNREFTLFQCNGTTYRARALPYLDALRWLEKVNALATYDEQLSQASGDLIKMGAIKIKYAEALADCVLDYNPDWDREEMKGKVSLEQISEAFLRLRDINDPFERIQSRESTKLSQRLSGLPPDVISQALKMTSSQ